MIHSRHFFQIQFKGEQGTDISNWFQSKSFSRRRAYGFQIYRNTRLDCMGKYIREVKFKEIVVTPDGEQLELDRINYEMIEFYFVKKNQILVLYNPPRNLSSFWSTISNSTGNEIFYQRLSIRTADLIKTTIKTGQLYRISRASIVKIQLDDFHAMEAIYSSQKDLTPLLESQNLIYKIKSAKMELILNQKTISLTCSPSGVVSSPSFFDTHSESALVEIALQSTFDKAQN